MTGVPRAAAGEGCVWITGASSGIGRALALRLASEGRVIVASARRDAILDETVAAAGAAGCGECMFSVPVDVTDAAAVRDAVTAIETAHGSIATAVLNAGTHQPMGAHDFSTTTLRRLFDVNFFGIANCIEALLPRMISRRGGQIVVVASVAGYRGLPTAAAYGATKAALINMVEALKPELDACGVDIRLVNPGFVRTPLTDRNPFPMPCLMEVDDAAEAFARGLAGNRFEIVFPRRFAYALKLLRLLPYSLAFRATRRLVPR